MTNKKHKQVKVSIVIPMFNEAESIDDLVLEIVVAMDKHFRLGGYLRENEEPGRYLPYEIIVVDDGSTDGSRGVVRAVTELVKQGYTYDYYFGETLITPNKEATLTPEVFAGLRLISLRRNQGKSAALAVGWKAARGEWVVTMDADGQDDPAELIMMLIEAEFEQKVDVLCARRANRWHNDPWHKTVPSRFYNWVTRTMTQVSIRDMNCGFKVYRREVVQEIKLYGDLHRFIPVLAQEQGFTIGEMDVRHRPRTKGVSKFGSERLWKGVLDFVLVFYLTKFLRKPFDGFGTVGLGTLLFGIIINLYLSWNWLMGASIGDRPLLLFGVLLMIFGAQMTGLGLIGEMFRHYFHNEGEIASYEWEKEKGDTAVTVPDMPVVGS